MCIIIIIHVSVSSLAPLFLLLIFIPLWANCKSACILWSFFNDLFTF